MPGGARTFLSPGKAEAAAVRPPAPDYSIATRSYPHRCVLMYTGLASVEQVRRDTTMPNLGALTEAAIRLRANDSSLARSEEYLARGAVVGIERRGDLLLAEVEGSAYTPYRVAVTFGLFGVEEATCTCPYEWG